MSLKEAVKNCFKKYTGFSGRASRAEYWLFNFFNYLVGIAWVMAAMLLLTVVTFNSEMSAEDLTEGPLVSWIMIMYIVLILFELAVFLPHLAVTWRRLHDIGKSGGCFFLCLIPIVGPFIVLFYTIRPSEKGANRFGPNPDESAENPVEMPAAGESIPGEIVCPECGTPVSAGDRFCTICGTPLDNMK